MAARRSNRTVDAMSESDRTTTEDAIVETPDGERYRSIGISKSDEPMADRDHD